MTQERTPLQEQLFALQDEKYRHFQCKLMPTVDPARVIGVRMPALRRLAGELAKTGAAEELLQTLPHFYYEENNLHGILLCRMRDYAQTVEALERFLPCVDNWATCDLLKPKAFAAHPDNLPDQLRRWIADPHPYTVRFAIGMLMQFYLDGSFLPVYADWVADIRREEYYIRMMVAWYFATALAKRYEAVLPYLQQRCLARWVHNKTIQKAVESYRLTEQQKTQLRALRWREEDGENKL